MGCEMPGSQMRSGVSRWQMLKSKPDVVSFILWASGLLVVVGIFLPWFTWGHSAFDGYCCGFAAVELVIVGPAAVIIATLLMVGIVADKPTVAALFGVLMLVLTALTVIGWNAICYDTYYRVCRIECASQCPLGTPSWGLLLTPIGSAMTAVSGFLKWKKKSGSPSSSEGISPTDHALD